MSNFNCVRDAKSMQNLNPRMKSAFVGVLFVLLSIGLDAPAAAHDDTGLAGGLASGFAHPFLGFDHMLAMVAVGIWGAFLGRPLIFVLPTLFPVMMTVGAGLAMAGFPVPSVEIGIASSVFILGIVIMMAVRLPALIACAVVAIFALFHGYAHGLELPSAADPVGYSVGFVFATGLLHLFGIALGMAKACKFGEKALRLVGAGIALVGASLLIGGLAS